MAADSSIERELKFDVAQGFDAPDLRPVAGGAVRLPELRFETSYLDTPDRRLWEQGMTLRHRVEHGEDGTGGPGRWTLKLPVGDAGGAAGLLNQRSEITWTGGRSEVPPGLQAVIAGVVRRAPLEQVAVLSAQRRRLQLGAAPPFWAEIDDDVVTVTAGSRSGLRFRQLELELGAGPAPAGALDQVLAQLERSGATPGGRSKLAMAAGFDEQPAAGVPEKGTAAAAARAILAADLAGLLHADCRIRVAAQMRAAGAGGSEGVPVAAASCAVRCLQADTRLLGALLDPVWVSHTRTELVWAEDALGRLSEADELAGRLRRWPRGRETPEVEELLRLLVAERHLEQEELLEDLASPRWIDLLDRVHAATSQPPGVPGKSPAGPLLARSLVASLASLRSLADGLGPDPSEEEMRWLGRQAGDLRHAASVAAPYVGKPSKRLARRAGALEAAVVGVLGAGDSAGLLEEMASHPSVTATVAFVAGRVAGHADSEADGYRAQWRRRAARLSRGADRIRARLNR